MTDTVVTVVHEEVEPESFVEYRLIRVADRLRRRFSDALRPHGLTPGQFSVLAVLQARPGVTAADLARAVLMTPQSMGTLIEQLERAGLVHERPRLGRGVPTPTEISAAGQRVLAEATVTVRDLDTQTRRALGEDVTPLLQSLDRLTRYLDDF
jgi:DNA-binding MarR family transcriptional regulator